MLRFIRLSLAMLIAVPLPGCAWLNRGKKRRAEEERASAALRAIPVGRVALVNSGERFALIEADLAKTPAIDTVLRSYTGGAVSAELRATGVRRRPFLVADLVSGTPQKGDLVVQPGAGEGTPPRAVAASAEPTPAAGPWWRRWSGFFRRK